MLIRSQNKKQLIDITGCTINVNIENEIGIWGNNSSNEDPALTLGYYSTEENAIKVLDMIQDLYYENMYSKFKTMENETFKTPIFQMPSDEKVENCLKEIVKCVKEIIDVQNK